MINVYHDFLCPFAWRGLELLTALEIPVASRHFSLLQGNHPENAGLPRNAPAWKLVDQTLGAAANPALPAYFNNVNGSLETFFASHAALQQGREAHLRFALELYRARHRDSKTLNAETALEAAKTAKLDLSAFNAALADEAARRTELAADLEAAGKLGVFGTPTIQLETGDIAYFRFSNLPNTKAEKRKAWKLFEGTLTSGARIETIKRAKP
jgi:predicted DsbA family dithiol-disulfide isomerase